MGIFQAVLMPKQQFHNLFDSLVAGHLHGLRQHAAAKIAGRRIVRRMGHCGQDIILCPSHRTTTHIIVRISLWSLRPGHRPQPLRRCHRCGQGHRAVARASWTPAGLDPPPRPEIQTNTFMRTSFAQNVSRPRHSRHVLTL